MSIALKQILCLWRVKKEINLALSTTIVPNIRVHPIYWTYANVCKRTRMICDIRLLSFFLGFFCGGVDGLWRVTSLRVWESRALFTNLESSVENRELWVFVNRNWESSAENQELWVSSKEKIVRIRSLWRTKRTGHNLPSILISNFLFLIPNYSVLLLMAHPPTTCRLTDLFRLILLGSVKVNWFQIHVFLMSIQLLNHVFPMSIDQWAWDQNLKPIFGKKPSKS